MVGVFVDVSVGTWVGVKVGVLVRVKVVVGVNVAVLDDVHVGVNVLVGVCDGVVVLVGVEVGVFVDAVELLPPPKSSSRALLAFMNHNPIYPPLVAYVQPLASREPIRIPLR